jgi:hypothetical protein
MKVYQTLWKIRNAILMPLKLKLNRFVAIKSTRLNHLGIVKERVSDEEENFGVNTCLASSTLTDKFTHFE